MGRGSSATALRYCVSGINAATAPGSVEDGSDRLPHGGFDEPILGRPSGITDVGGSAQSKPFRQAVELSGRPLEPGVHREPINFLSGCPLLLLSRTRFPWTQNWLNRSVQGGPEHDR